MFPSGCSQRLSGVHKVELLLFSVWMLTGLNGALKVELVLFGSGLSHSIKRAPMSWS